MPARNMPRRARPFAVRPFAIRALVCAAAILGLELLAWALHLGTTYASLRGPMVLGVAILVFVLPLPPLRMQRPDDGPR